jgi:signal peptidase II
VADSCIVCGGILAVFLAVRGVRIDGTLASKRPDGDGERSQPADDSGHADGDEHGGGA